MSSIVVDTGDAVRRYQALVVRLKAAADGRELQRELKRRIAVAGAPALASVRRAALAVEVTSTAGGGSSSGLRARVAAATEIRVLPSGIRIRVIGKKVDPVHGRSLARSLNATNGRPWVHPLFGDQQSQHAQAGAEFFAPAIRAHAPRFRQAVEGAMAEVADMIRG